MINSHAIPVHTFTTYFFMIQFILLIPFPYWNMVNSHLKLKKVERAGMAAPCTTASKRTLPTTRSSFLNEVTFISRHINGIVV
jgi:hypothetical protein